VFDKVSFRYPGADRDALTDIDLTIDHGETVALVGRNGAGKTTLVKLLVGLYRPTSGRILIDGADVVSMTAAELRRKVGIIFQDFARFQFSAGDNVGVGWLPARGDTVAIERAVEDAGRRRSSAACPRVSTHRWAARSAATISRSASGNASPWRGRSCARVAFSSSTSPRHRWTRKRSTRSSSASEI